MPAVPSYEQYTCFNIPSFWHSSAADKLRTAERLAQCPYCHGELVRYVDSRFYPVPHIPTEKAHAASSSRDSHDALSFWRDKANLSLAVGQSSSGDQQDEFVAVCKTCGFWFGNQQGWRRHPCAAPGRKSTATEALLSACLITGEKICAALRVGQPATVVLMSGRSLRTRLGSISLLAVSGGLEPATRGVVRPTTG
jgi:hypothetical protein